MPLALRYSALSDVGRVRHNNEDSGYASSRIIVLADGMGGMAAGELASSVTVQTVRSVDVKLEADVLEVLAGAVQRANDQLGDIIAADPSLEGMGTTLTAIMTDGERVALVHVGDSRAYRLRDGQLQQISRDHTFVQSLVDEGRITPAEARVHPHRSVLIRALDGRQDMEPDLSIIDAVAGDRLMVCSDGVTDYLRDDQIRELLSAETIDMAAVDLVRSALEAGSADNVSCVIADVVDEDLPPEDPMIIGAAAEDVRPASVHGGPHSSRAVPVSDPDDDDDDTGASAPTAGQDLEELRYAPRAPRRFAWLRRLLLLTAVLVVLALVASFGYDWTQRQYYVGVGDDGEVAVYRGVEQSLLGYELSEIDRTYDLAVTALPDFRRESVENGIPASDLADAERIVSDLQADADECSGESPDAEDCAGVDPTTAPADPSESPSEEPTPSQTTQPTEQPQPESTRRPRTNRGNAP
jgi:protein phosphatase